MANIVKHCIAPLVLPEKIMIIFKIVTKGELLTSVSSLEWTWSGIQRKDKKEIQIQNLHIRYQNLYLVEFCDERQKRGEVWGLTEEVANKNVLDFWEVVLLTLPDAVHKIIEIIQFWVTIYKGGQVGEVVT